MTNDCPPWQLTWLVAELMYEYVSWYARHAAVERWQAEMLSFFHATNAEIMNTHSK